MGRSKTALAILALSAFAVGTCELVVVGLLDLMAGSMSVSVSTAGQLVTAYALGIAFGGPILAAVTARMSRRTLLALSLSLFIVGNVLTLLAVGYEMLLVARILTGSVQGLFMGVAFMVAAGLVTPDRRGRAMSMVFGGIAVATVLGVPLGTLLGRAVGWRATFVVIVVLASVALVCVLVWVPQVARQGTETFGVQARAAFAPRVLAMLGVALLLLGGQFTAFTYLSLYLQQVAGVSGSAVSGFLLVNGVASAIGTFAGGRTADHAATATLVAGNVLLIVALAGLFVFGSTPACAALALAVWGVAGFGVVPSLQLRVIGLAGPGGDLAATLGASAVNLGIAGGAAVGGCVVAGPGIRAVVLAGLIIVAVALPATCASGYLRPAQEPPSSSRAPAPPAAPILAAACHAVCLVEAGKAASTVFSTSERGTT